MLDFLAAHCIHTYVSSNVTGRARHTLWMFQAMHGISAYLSMLPRVAPTMLNTICCQQGGSKQPFNESDLEWIDLETTSLV